MAPSPRLQLVESIEQKTGQKVVIDTIETDGVLAKCCQQNKSPLFTLLPRELRDLIWAFVTAPVGDTNKPFNKNAYFYRPGHTARLKTDYNILLTCRQAWLEAHALPMLQAEHSFWYYREAPDARSKEWMANLTPLDRKHFGTLHLYAQMYAIEPLTSQLDRLRDYFLPSASNGSDDFQPARFHVTIRHTDWWYWEDEAPLRFEYSWFQAMLDSPDLRRTETLKLELETLDYKVSQLNPIVDHILSLRSQELATHVVNDKPTTTRFVLTGEPEVSSWTGPTDLDSKEFAPYKDKKELKYHVVTLTWKLYFPQYPKAHVPNLRLAPPVHFKRGRPASFAWRQRLERSNSMSSDDDGAIEPDMPDPEPRLSRWPLSARHSRRAWRRVAHIRAPTSSQADDEASGEGDEMFECGRKVQMRSSWQARWNELFRRRQFRRCMKSQQETYWWREFAEKNSLLRLEHR
jgi:hypothetical protein